MNIRDQITKDVSELLEPNLQFYRTDPSDASRYFAGPEVLNTLAWTASTIAIPILLCGVNEVVKDRVQGWLKTWKESKKPPVEPPDSLQHELAQILEGKGAIVIANDQVTDAVEAVSSYLSHRGWPKALAYDDAAEIVEVIRKVAGARS